MKFDESVLIKKPVEQVWDFWANLENAPIISHNTIKKARVLTEGPVQVGSKFLWVVNFLGREQEQTMEVTEDVPYKMRAWKNISGPGTLKQRYTFQPTPEGTKVTAYLEGDPAEGFFKVAGPVFNTMLKRNIRGSLEDMRDLLEAQAPVTA